MWDEDSHCALPAHVDANNNIIIVTLNIDGDFEVMKAVTFGFDIRHYATEVIRTDEKTKHARFCSFRNKVARV